MDHLLVTFTHILTELSIIAFVVLEFILVASKNEVMDFLSIHLILIPYL